MTYVYMALISYGVFIFGILSVAGLLVWALPRYGAQALRMAIAPKFPPVMPPSPTISDPYTGDK